MAKNVTLKFVYALRNIRSRELFRALEKYCRGQVLDVGGRDFFLFIRNRKGINFTKWTTLEPKREHLPEISDPRFCVVEGDGSAMQFAENSFDTVLNIQVLEHVFEPERIIREIERVLQPGGQAVFLIPNSSVLHHAPEHYYNFTKFWILRSFEKTSLEIVMLKPLGGLWSTTASHMFYFFLKSWRAEGYSTTDNRRNIFFFVLYPLMAVWALVNMAVCLLFSLGDLTEDPNNYLVVVRKRERS